MNKPTKLTLTLIPGSAVVLAALIGIYPSLHDKKNHAVIAGIVVDRDTNKGIGQAKIVLAGHREQYLTEDSGNFKIQLQDNSVSEVRLHVSKDGFRPFDESVNVPADNLVLQLHKE